MKVQVHLTHKDEETRDFYREFCGHIDIPEGMSYFEARKLACERLANCYYNESTSVKFTPVGVRVKLRGRLPKREVDRLWRVVRLSETALE